MPGSSMPLFAETPEFYNRVKALIAANEVGTLRQELERVLDTKNQYAYWSIYKGANHLAEVAQRNSDPREEEIWRERSFRASAHLGRPGARAFALIYYRPFLELQERFDEARQWALEVLPQLPPEDERVWRLAMPLANRATYEGRFDEALELLATAEGASSSNPALLARVVGGRGQIALDHGRVEVAAQAFRREQELAEAGTGQHGQQALRASYLHRVNLRLATGQVSRIDRLVQEALARSDLLATDPTFRPALRLRQAAAAMARERAEPATTPSARSRFQEVIEDPGATSSHRQAAQLRLAHMACNDGDFATARQHLDALPEELPPLDHIYGRLLWARVARHTGSDAAAVETDFARSWSSLASTWRQQRHPDGTGFLHDERVRLFISDWIELRLENAAPEQALELAMAARSFGHLHESLSAEDASLDRVREELLGPNGSIAVFWPAADRSHVFLLDSNSVKHVELPSRDTIEALRVEVAELMRTPPARGAVTPARVEQLNLQLRALGSALLPPTVERWLLEHDDLTIVGADLLRPIPYSALLLSDGSAVADHCDIAMLPSLSVGLALQARRYFPTNRSADKVLLLGAPSLSPALREEFPNALPFELTANHARSIVAPYQDATLLQDDAATWEQLTSTVGEVVVAQLIVHGARDPSRGGKPVLLLAGDQRAGSDELGQLSAAPLMILTACGTGQGPMRLGDAGTSDLSGPLLTAGAQCVILPPADLSYQATLALSQYLHRALRDGHSPASAVRLARRQMIRDGEWTDPTHHSQLQVIGLAHQPLFEAQPEGSRFPFFALGFFGAAVSSWLFLWWRTRRRRLAPEGADSVSR